MKLQVNELQNVEVTDEEILAPATIIRAMNLHRGYVPTAEIRKTGEAWSGTPVTVGHPTDNDGDLVSINHEEADKEPVGEIRDPVIANDGEKTDGKVKLDRESVEETEPRVAEDLEAGVSLNVSSSYRGVPLPPGMYDGEYRSKVIGNLRPDHVAILPDTSGRCSLQDGCGVGPIAANESAVLVNGVTDDPGDGEVAYNARSTARTPSYSGTETTSWSDVDKTFSNFLSAVDGDTDDVSSVDDLSGSQKTEIAEHSLLGEADADSFDDLLVFPVVNPDTGSLNEGALDAVIGGRGAQADISSSALDSARSTARSLLEDEFDRDLQANARGLVQKAMNFVGLGTESGNEPAESGVDDDQDIDVIANATNREIRVDLWRDVLADLAAEVNVENVDLRNYQRLLASEIPGASIDEVASQFNEETLSDGLEVSVIENELAELRPDDGEPAFNMTDKTTELVEEHGFNAENLPDEETECFDRIHELATNQDESNEDEDEEPDSDEEEEPEEPEEETQEAEPAVTFETEEEFESAVKEVMAANQEESEREELAGEIIANSDKYDEDDRDHLEDTPTPVLEDLASNVKSEGQADYSAIRGASAEVSANEASDFPSLKATDHVTEDD